MHGQTTVRRRLINLGRVLLVVAGLIAGQLGFATPAGRDTEAQRPLADLDVGAARSRGPIAQLDLDESDSREAAGQRADVGGSAKAQASPIADVRSFGAVGDGASDDTAPIQEANDWVSARGGGRVFFPAGVYLAAGLVQDSGVDFVGARGATLKHPDGISPNPIVTSRTFATTGSIEQGSRSLKVADARGIKTGSVIATRGAGGASTVQHTTLAIASFLSEDRLKLADANGFGAGPNHLIVGSEVISYEGIDLGWLVGVKRGLFGTRPSDHPGGELVSQLRVHYALVENVSGTSVRLDRPVATAVVGAPVETGSQNLVLKGLSLDGNRWRGIPRPSNPVAVSYSLARRVTITRCTIRNGVHGAVIFDRGTRDSTIRRSDLTDSGMPKQRLGAVVWLFRGAAQNSVENNRIGDDSYLGVAIDDRTTGSTEWDADSRNNRVIDNRIDIRSSHQNSGVLVSNSTENVVASNAIADAFYGVQVLTSEQGTRPATARENVIRDNTLRRHDVGLNVTGSRNTFARNVFAAVGRSIIDDGYENRFEENSSR